MKRKVMRFMFHPRVKVVHRYHDGVFYVAEAWIENSDGTVMVDVDTGDYLASLGISRRSAFDEYDHEEGMTLAGERAIEALYKKLFPESDVKPHVYKRL